MQCGLKKYNYGTTFLEEHKPEEVFSVSKVLIFRIIVQSYWSLFVARYVDFIDSDFENKTGIIFREV